MAKQLSDATTEELNAAFDAVNDMIRDVVLHFVPRFFQRQALEAINSAEGRKEILKGVDAALDAVEELRKKKGLPA